MKLIVQRSKEASVKVENEVIGKIDRGLVVLVGIAHHDTATDVEAIVNKLINLRIFEDEMDKLNLSVLDVEGSILSISQFTLYGDVKKGRRPSFSKAADPHLAESLYDLFNDKLRAAGLEVATGRFGSMMDISLVNHGPITLVVETKEGKII